MARSDGAEGEVVHYDYGFAFDDFENHVCQCGFEQCVRYIVSEEYKEKVRRVLNEKCLLY
jgi:hypothetical protein